MDYLRGVLQGQKKLFRLNEIKIMDNIPRYPEIDLSNIWENVKQNDKIQLFFPDTYLNQKKPPYRTFLLTVSWIGDFDNIPGLL